MGHTQRNTATVSSAVTSYRHGWERNTRKREREGRGREKDMENNALLRPQGWHTETAGLA